MPGATHDGDLEATAEERVEPQKSKAILSLTLILLGQWLSNSRNATEYERRIIAVDAPRTRWRHVP
ncbi:hypothetical protein T265_02197 [Opisthorchis viverrini]|uniref:Uncharacterized protein n=1 Tax=Opisthorchis viverrini TaxID=6198 RepID=A0A074ZVQ6_OPIVI|nr:hypothetical protein T265_02197 [Opisthorchis viverrini]KER31553.1 hypothetical protein T265_02197 [Opisthorchis viverrini]